MCNGNKLRVRNLILAFPPPFYGWASPRIDNDIELVDSRIRQARFGIVIDIVYYPVKYCA